MSEKSLSYPYAKAYLDLSKENGTLDMGLKDMELISQTGADNPELKTVLANPLHSLDKKRDILFSIFKALQPETKKLIEILFQKERPGLIFSVASEFISQYRVFKNIQRVEVCTAAPISSKLQDQILQELEKSLNGKVEIVHTVDPELIGGMVVQIGDRRYDGTIRKSLQNVKKSLMDRL